MMNLKNLLAGAVVTAAVTSALVLGTAVGADAQVFPTPTPIGPGSVSKPISTQPSLPGFHLPAELWTHYGPQVKPSAPTPYSALPATCSSAIGPYLLNQFAIAGYRLTGDNAVHATADPQLLTLLSHASRQISCRWVNPTTGGIVDVTDAIGIDDAAVGNRLVALGFSAPGPVHGYQLFADGTSYEQDIAVGQGGWTLVSTSGAANDWFGVIMQDAPDALYVLNH